MAESETNKGSLIERARRVAEMVIRRERGPVEQITEDLTLDYGKQWQERRKAHGITRADLGSALSINPEELFRLEHGLLTDEEIAQITPLLNDFYDSNP